jgi:hypothetical protein
MSVYRLEHVERDKRAKQFVEEATSNEVAQHEDEGTMDNSNGKIGRY